MKCVFDEKKECVVKNASWTDMANYCHACTARQTLNNMKAAAILTFLRMFPNDMEKAKKEYQKVMQYVEEW